MMRLTTIAPFDQPISTSLPSGWRRTDSALAEAGAREGDRHAVVEGGVDPQVGREPDRERVVHWPSHAPDDHYPPVGEHQHVAGVLGDRRGR